MYYSTSHYNKHPPHLCGLLDLHSGSMGLVLVYLTYQCKLDPRVYLVLLDPAAEPLGSQPHAPASERWGNMSKEPFPAEK